jgi:hypothetical protein
MPAKVAGTWQVLSPVGVADISQFGTTKLHPLGTRCRARDVGTTDYGYGEFIYLEGVASTIRGPLVLITDLYATTLITARDKGALAIALSANAAASSYGWYQILGKGVISAATVAANVPLYIAGSNLVDDTAVAGDQIIGMRSVSATDTATAVVNMSCYPATADFDNA